MSFGINGPENIPSIQKSHHTNDGGAGNLGYFKRQKKKHEDETEEEDIFELSSKDNEEEEKHEDTIENVGNRIKNFWIKFKIKNRLEQEIEKLNNFENSEEENNPEDE